MPPTTLHVALLLLAQTFADAPPSPSPPLAQPGTTQPDAAASLAEPRAPSDPGRSVPSPEAYAAEPAADRPSSGGPLRGPDGIAPDDRYQPQVAPPRPFRSSGEFRGPPTSSAASANTLANTGSPASPGSPAAPATPDAPAAPSAPLAVGWLQGVWNRLPEVGGDEQPVMLFDAVQRGTLTGRRAPAVRAYWQLCGKHLHVVLARQESELVEQLEEAARRSASVGGEPVEAWVAFREDAQARLRTAELEELRTQLELLGFWPLGTAASPRCREMPFIGAYRTNFETLFTLGTAPSALRRLHETLPLELAALEARARATLAQARVGDALREAYRQGEVDLGPVVAARDRLRRQQARLIEAIVGYNQRIAEYALAVAGGESDGTVAAMLIPQPSLPVAARVIRGGVQPAFASQPLESVPLADPRNQPAVFREVPPATVPPARVPGGPQFSRP